MESDHEYFWSKNIAPNQSQNHDRNRNAEHTLAHLKDKSGIIKTYHVWEGDDQFTNRYWEKLDRTEMSKDMKPFVMHSMNKRRNWEVEDLDSVEFIGKIQEMHKGEDVMVLERTAIRTYPWRSTFRYQFYWDHYKIHTMHELDSYVDGRPFYKKTTSNCVFGQHPHHFLASNRTSNKEESERLKKERIENLDKEKRTVVVYHLIKSPENYMEMFKKEFGKESNHPSRWAAQSYWERKRKQFMDSQDLRYDDFTEDDTEITEDLDSENEKEIPRFYKLEDHLVDNFVMVKKKKKRKKI